MGKKYTLTDETMDWQGHTLHRIKYADGTQGGWIESEDNLSQEGRCRVLDEAKVFAPASVSENAIVFDKAEVHGWVYGNAKVYGNAIVAGKIYGKAKVYENARIYIAVEVYGDAEIFGNAEVAGLGGVCRSPWTEAKIYGCTKIFGDACVTGIEIAEGGYGTREAVLKLERELELKRTREAAEEHARKIEEAKRVSRRLEIVDEIIYMIENCPQGAKFVLREQIALLLLSFDSEERDKILALYETWREKHGSAFAPTSSVIKDEIRRIQQSGVTPSEYIPRPSLLPPSYGGGGGASRSRFDSFMEDMERARQAQEHAKWQNPPPSGMD